MDEVVTRAAAWAGVTITPDSRRRLMRYAEWLRTEATAAGGLGPRETDRVEGRHVADSLCLARGWAGVSSVDDVVDVGSGVGLPGIPLAITHPHTRFSLLDRSGRRCQLLRRACRVVGVENAEVMQVDADTVERQWQWLVARAWTPPSRIEAYLRLLKPGGRAVIAGSHRNRPDIPGYATIEVPAMVLDSPAWILTMARP